MNTCINESLGQIPLKISEGADYLSIVDHLLSMEDVDEYLSSRRNFIKTGATAAIAGLAGCSGDDGGNGGNTNNSTDTENPAEQPGTEEGSDPTETNNPGTETSDGQQTEDPNSEASSLYEEDETEAEVQWENDTFNAFANDGWIEMENPSEQIPEDNYDFEEFPNLQIFEEIEIYSDNNEAVYLAWADTGERVELGAFQVSDYESGDGTGTSGSGQYTDQSADTRRILEEVIEGVDDVSEDISDEYAEILRNS